MTSRRLLFVLVVAILMAVATSCACAQDYYVRQDYDGKAQWVQVDPNAKTVHIQAAASDTRAVAQKGFWQSAKALTWGHWGVGLAILAIVLALIALFGNRRNGGNDNATQQAQMNAYLAGNGGRGGWLPMFLRGPQGPPGQGGPNGANGEPGACQCKPKDKECAPPQAECIDETARKTADQALEQAARNRRRLHRYGQIMSTVIGGLRDHKKTLAQHEEALALNFSDICDHQQSLEEYGCQIAALGDFAVATTERPSVAEFYRRRGITAKLQECGFGS